MTATTFQKSRMSRFGYYFKMNRSKIRSVPAPLKNAMIGNATKSQRKSDFTEVGNHVIACDIRSKDWFIGETTWFLDKQLVKKINMKTTQFFFWDPSAHMTLLLW
jgi:hypothetical protein